MTVAKPRKRWIVSSQDTRDNEDTSSLVARPKGDIRLPISQQRVAFKRHGLDFGGRDTGD